MGMVTELGSKRTARPGRVGRALLGGTGPAAATDWATPPDVFAEFDAEFGFTLDVCASPWNAKLPRFFTEDQDGLTQDWSGERCFLNPPYGRGIEPWLRKAFTETRWRCPLVVALIPVRTDTRWWHVWVAGAADDVRYRKGRIRFIGRTGEAWSAPFASALAIYQGDGVLVALRTPETRGPQRGSRRRADR
jgi:site-specific DNA-methyltransferase (adenine-specific)